MLAAFVLALLAAFGLAAVSAEEQTGVILTHPPDKASAEYRALRDVGAPIGGRDLTMTGAEMWTVPEAHYAALRDAAMKQGVALHRLGDSADSRSRDGHVGRQHDAGAAGDDAQDHGVEGCSWHEHDEAARSCDHGIHTTATPA